VGFVSLTPDWNKGRR